MATATVTAIDLKPVTSTRIAEAGYNPNTFTLAIRFTPTKASPKGALYQYHNVSEEMADDFLHAESLGKFFAAHLLNNPDHPCTKVQEDDATAPETQKQPQPAAKRVVARQRSKPKAAPAQEPVAESPSDDKAELKRQAATVQNNAQALQIPDAAAYELAANELIRVRHLRLKAQSRIDKIKRPAYQTYKATLELEREVMASYKAAEDYLNRAMAGYRETERRARLAREAEENRRRREEAEAEAAKHAAAIVEADAQLAELQGRPEVAQEIRQQPLPLVPVRVQPCVLEKEVPRVAGIIERPAVWLWRVRPGEEHLVPRQYLKLDEVAINAAVRTQKSLTSIPGIEVWDEEANVGVRA